MLAIINSINLFSLTPTSFYMIVVVAIVGMGALLFTTYRTVVGYFLAGMGYWLVVEGLAWMLTKLFLLEALHGYVFAVGLTFISILMGLNWLENRQKTIRFSTDFFQKPVDFSKKPHQTKLTPPSILMAGQRPLMLEQDTDFSQHFIRHSPVFDYE